VLYSPRRPFRCKFGLPPSLEVPLQLNTPLLPYVQFRPPPSLAILPPLPFSKIGIASSFYPPSPSGFLPPSETPSLPIYFPSGLPLCGFSFFLPPEPRIPLLIFFFLTTFPPSGGKFFVSPFQFFPSNPPMSPRFITKSGETFPFPHL